MAAISPFDRPRAMSSATAGLAGPVILLFVYGTVGVSLIRMGDRERAGEQVPATV
ncbi:hypothetical protein [Nonomuraea sp. NPDC048826]|uniref:hypothetical protein n=1 Tax=Nonomuraea sp. NPDC048826 TaxID=3364347 RepID=UPI00371E7E3A